MAALFMDGTIVDGIRKHAPTVKTIKTIKTNKVSSQEGSSINLWKKVYEIITNLHEWLFLYVKLEFIEALIEFCNFQQNITEFVCYVWKAAANVAMAKTLRAADLDSSDSNVRPDEWNSMLLPMHIKSSIFFVKFLWENDLNATTYHNILTCLFCTLNKWKQ